jgi:IS30 family transposase
MARRFKHLTLTDRLKIEALAKAGKRVGEIASLIGTTHATISRELKKGQCIHMTTEHVMIHRYAAEVADRKYREHLKAKGADLKIGKDHKLAQYIEARIADDKYSPAAVLGEIKVTGMIFTTSICVSTLYSYIDKEIFSRITNKDLPQRGKRKRVYRKIQPSRPPRGESIEKRPHEVGSRSTFGHWEIDTMHSTEHKKQSLLVLTERKTRKEIIRYMPDRTSDSVVKSLDRLERQYGSLFPKVFQSITCDNGSEFADHKGIELGKHRIKRTTLYYCHPYSAYERGSNENQNKLIRRHFPKGTDFAKITDKDIAYVERWINRYPRKIFGYQSADTMFNQHIAELQVT